MARLKRNWRVRRRLHSLLKAPIRTTAPLLRSENELSRPLRMMTCLFLASSAPTTLAMVTVSAKGTVCDESELGTGVTGLPLAFTSGTVGGPFGWSPTTSSTEPGVSRTGFQKRPSAFVLCRLVYPAMMAAIRTAAAAAPAYHCLHHGAGWANLVTATVSAIVPEPATAPGPLTATGPI